MKINHGLGKLKNKIIVWWWWICGKRCHNCYHIKMQPFGVKSGYIKCWMWKIEYRKNHTCWQYTKKEEMVVTTMEAMVEFSKKLRELINLIMEESGMDKFLKKLNNLVEECSSFELEWWHFTFSYFAIYKYGFHIGICLYPDCEHGVEPMVTRGACLSIFLLVFTFRIYQRRDVHKVREEN